MRVVQTLGERGTAHEDERRLAPVQHGGGFADRALIDFRALRNGERRCDSAALVPAHIGGKDEGRDSAGRAIGRVHRFGRIYP